MRQAEERKRGVPRGAVIGDADDEEQGGERKKAGAGSSSVSSAEKLHGSYFGTGHVDGIRPTQ